MLTSLNDFHNFFHHFQFKGTTNSPLSNESVHRILRPEHFLLY